MKRALLTLAICVTCLPSFARAEVRCYVGTSPRRDAITTLTGSRVELYDTFLKVDGAVLSRCDGLPGARPTAIAAFGEGYAVGFRDEGLFVSDGARFRRMELPSRDAVRALATAGGALWVGLMREGLVRLDEEPARGGPANTSRVRPIRHPQLRGGRAVTALGVDERGALLVGVDPMMQLRIDPSTNAVTVLRARAPVGCFRANSEGAVVGLPPGPSCTDSEMAGELPSGHVSSLAHVGEEMLVGTFDAGTYVMRGGEVVGRFASPRFVNAVVTTRGETFVAAAEGLFHVVVEAQRIARLDHVVLPAESRHVHDVMRASDGTLWVATSHGLLGIARSGTRVLTEGSGLPSRIVYVVAEARDGALWAGTLRGAVRIAQDGVRVYSSSTGALRQDWVTALLPTDDGMLVGTYNAGTVALDAAGTPRVLHGRAAQWVSPRGLTRDGESVLYMTMGEGLWRDAARVDDTLPELDVTAALRFEGALWVGTRSGLGRLSARNEPR